MRYMDDQETREDRSRPLDSGSIYAAKRMKSVFVAKTAMKFPGTNNIRIRGYLHVMVLGNDEIWLA